MAKWSYIDDDGTNDGNGTYYEIDIASLNPADARQVIADRGHTEREVSFVSDGVTYNMKSLTFIRRDSTYDYGGAYDDGEATTSIVAANTKYAIKPDFSDPDPGANVFNWSNFYFGKDETEATFTHQGEEGEPIDIDVDMVYETDVSCQLLFSVQVSTDDGTSWDDVVGSTVSRAASTTPDSVHLSTRLNSGLNNGDIVRLAIESDTATVTLKTSWHKFRLRG